MKQNELPEKIAKQKLLIETRAADLFAHSGDLNPKLLHLIDAIQMESEDRLLSFYAEALRSYSYLTLTEPPQTLNLSYLIRTLKTLSSSETNTEEQLIAMIRTAYLSAIDALIGKLADSLKANQNLVNPYIASVDLELNNDQILNLNQTNELVLKLTPPIFGPLRTNIRVIKVEVIDPDFDFPFWTKFIPKQWTQGPSSILWQAMLGDTAAIEAPDHQFRNFTYYGMDPSYQWQATTQILKDRTI